MKARRNTRAIRGAELLLVLATVLGGAGCIAQAGSTDPSSEVGGEAKSNPEKGASPSANEAYDTPNPSSGQEGPYQGGGLVRGPGEPQPSPWEPSEPTGSNEMPNPGTLNSPQPSPWMNSSEQVTSAAEAQAAPFPSKKSTLGTE
jgi:hypothetical protein